jgi:voltage-gated potassium channel
VFITLSARRISSELVIVARSTSPETVDKLEIAGADRVVSPFEIGGRRMAMAALRPLAADVFDTLATRSPDGRRIAEVVVSEGSPLARHAVHEFNLEEGVRILAISKKGGELLVTPANDTVIELGDAVMLVGPNAQLERFEGGNKQK